MYLEFVLNHLHSSHKHRRFNGDSLDMTMVVPQVDVEQNSNTIRSVRLCRASSSNESPLP